MIGKRTLFGHHFFHAFLFPFAAVALFQGCATYTDSTKEMHIAIENGSPSLALQKLDASKVAKSASDQVLYRMERGSLLYEMRRYSEAVKEWALASQRIEELYTVSLTKQAASLAITESFADYEGEAHERILLPVFSALAFMASNEPSKAIVEARRTNEVLKVLEQNKDKNPNLPENLFAHYLSGYIYEGRREWDSAIIEYRKAWEATQGNKIWSQEAAKKLVASALLPLADLRRRKEIVAQVRAQLPDLRYEVIDPNAPASEVLVVFEQGRAPIKVPQDIPVPIDSGVINISFPTYQEFQGYKQDADVYLDRKKVATTTVLEDVGELAKASLSARRAKEIVRMIARVVAKDQAARAVGRSLGPLAGFATSIAGAVTERADTRSWTLLPDTVQVARIRVQPGVSKMITVKPERDRAEDFNWNLAAGEKRFLRIKSR